MSIPAIWWSRSGKGTDSVWFRRTLRSFPFDCGRFFSLPSPHSMPSLFTVLPRFWVCKIVFWNLLISSPLFLCFFLRILIASLCFIGKSEWVWNFNREIWRLRFRVCVCVCVCVCVDKRLVAFYRNTFDESESSKCTVRYFKELIVGKVFYNVLKTLIYGLFLYP